MSVDLVKNPGSLFWSLGSGRLASLAMRVRDFGIEGYPAASQRRLRQVNVLNAFMVASYLIFAAFYVVLDWQGLKLLALALLANVPLFFVPPFLHRYSEIAAVTWIAVQNALTFLVFGLIVGSAAGMQFWLLAAGILIVFFGTERLPIALPMICLLVGMFLAIEFWVPRFSEWSPITPSVAAVIKTIAVCGGASITTGFVYLAMYMARQAEAALETEYARSETLLRSIMPDKIAALDRLYRAEGEVIELLIHDGTTGPTAIEGLRDVVRE